MASHEPDSVATVGSQDLGILQQFMQTHWEQPNRVVANPQHQEDSNQNTNANTDTPNDRSRVPESDERLYQAKPPRLITSKSAPHDMEMTASPGNAFETKPLATLARAQSFQFGGDTQELNSQELRESMKHSMSRPSDATPGTAQRTQKEGDTGYINLESEWDTQGFEDVFLNETQAEPPVPVTPALYRNQDTEIPTTAKKTPHYSQFFGAANPPPMTASQLIDQTQQPSSPVGLIHSDPIDNRPSPGERSSPSLVGFSNSSPNLGRNDLEKEKRPRTAPGEPRAYYRSLQESQALREARAALRSPGELQNDGDDDEFEEESFTTKRRKIRRALSDNALRVIAPARPGSRRTWSKKSRATMIDLTTPAPTKRQRVQFEPLGEDEELEDNGAEEVEEPLHDEEYVSTPLGSVHDDEYDEFSQNIVGQVDADASTVASLEDIDHEMDDRSPSQNQEDQGAEEVTERRDRRDGGESTQKSTVADSQPDGHAAIIRHIQHSSTTSFVPGSQHAGKTSEDRALLASSQRRSQLRVAASQVDREDSSNGADKVPSSPPLLRVSSTFPEGEIPESDAMEAEASKVEIAMDEDQNEDEETQDATRDGGAPFSTARTHVSGSVESPARKSVVPSPRKASQSQRSYLTEPSPRKLAGARRFADFANGTSTNGSFELEADVDDIMQGVITEEDQQVWDSTSGLSDLSRMNKRRKTSHTASSRTTSTKSNRAPDATVRVEETIDELAIAESEPDIVRPDSPPAALRDSPNKANEMLPPPLNKGKVKVSDVVSESVMLREKAGSDAVSQLVRDRGTTAKKTKQVTYGRSSRRRSSKSAAVNGSIEDDQALAAAVEESAPAIEESVVSMDVDDSADQNVPPGLNASTPDVSFDLHPKRIFALFKGSPLAFYPATWLGSSPDGTTFKVRFDDGAETNIETHHVKTLELRIDDSIKVNVAGLRNKTWRITGFGAPAHTREERGFATDANGHIRVKIQAKGNRNSLSNDASSEAAGDADGDGIREVLIEHIYLTNTMWPSFADRIFTPPAKARSDRAQTPLAQDGTPGSEPPPSRSRRAIVPTAKAKVSGLRLSHLRDTSSSSSRSAGSTGIFSGMAFAVTYVANDAEKADVTRLIGRHGGTILDGGFEELFELPNIGEPAQKSTQKQMDEAETGLRLKSEHKDLGFVALIADKHSRRAKYMQALALGLPTLSGRWVLDSLDSSKNKPLISGSVDPLPWERYLLPAGESAYLGGAIRSRTLTSYESASAALQATISSRPTLLDGESVLIVAPKKDKAGWEKRRTYAFLTLALGAGQVKRVYDIEEAKSLIDPEIPMWLYVDGPLSKARAALSDAGKKRKRGAEVKTGNVRIVDDEFVVQSLILGALYE